MFQKCFSDCLYYFCSTCADSITGVDGKSKLMRCKSETRPANDRYSFCSHFRNRSWDVSMRNFYCLNIAGIVKKVFITGDCRL